MMNWKQLLTTKRLGLENLHRNTDDVRSEYERDYDRLIFSAPFRRLQNKTQVFPLPGTIFVHNRLTHSLEVSTVGRSLGNRVSRALRERYPDLDAPIEEIGSIVSAACLAHDLGNPPFGHTGEKAIGTYFSEGKGQRFKQMVCADEWTDFTCFEGNANAFRLLSHRFEGHREGGFVLTYSTLASIVKYPYASKFCPQGKQKFGFFQQDMPLYERIAEDLGICRKKGEPNKYARYPLVYLVEAADDICYEIMDIEDACKLHIISFSEAKELLLAFHSDERQAKIQKHLDDIADTNEQLAYLRSCVIGKLVDECAKAFVEHEQQILEGELVPDLTDLLPEQEHKAFKACKKAGIEKIYRSQMVLDIELAGHKVIQTLLEEYLEAEFSRDKDYSQRLLQRIPNQYNVDSDDPYVRIMKILDFLAGMTDVYILDLYRKITGISIPSL